VTLFGALFGFVITAASITVALVTEEKMRLFVAGKKYPQVWDTFTQTIATLGIAAAVSFIGLVLVRDSGTHLAVLCLLTFLGILASLRLMRTVWLLDALPRLHAAMVKRA
jgi:CHASE2 domain-containing sensor protein